MLENSDKNKPLIVLISPKSGWTRQRYSGSEAPREPLSILSLGSYLKDKEISVKLIDSQLYCETTSLELIKSTLIKKPLLFGFSVMTSQVSHALELSEFIRSLDPNIPIVWGGVHPTLFPIETSQDDLVDIIVHGRGEVALLEICEQLINNNKINPDTAGICIKGKYNCAGKVAKDTNYPWFDYDILDLKHYLGPTPHFPFGKEPNRVLQVISSRGCPWRCAFCINEVTRNRWSPEGSERYVDMIEFLIKKYELDGYRAMDEDFFPNRKRTFGIVEELLKRGINKTWGTNIRANYFNDKYVTVDFAKKLRATGCKFFNIGAESGSQRVLDYLKKDITVDQLIHSAEVCNEAGITPIYSWMTAIPTETRQEQLTTLRLMRTIKGICQNSLHYSPQIYRPYPGGFLYEMCIKMGLETPDDLRGWHNIGADQRETAGLGGYFSIANLKWIEDEKLARFTSDYGWLVSLFTSYKWYIRLLSNIVMAIINNWDRSLTKRFLLVSFRLLLVLRKIKNRFRTFDQISIVKGTLE